VPLGIAHITDLLIASPIINDADGGQADPVGGAGGLPGAGAGAPRAS